MKNWTRTIRDCLRSPTRGPVNGIRYQSPFRTLTKRILKLIAECGVWTGTLRSQCHSCSFLDLVARADGAATQLFPRSCALPRGTERALARMDVAYQSFHDNASVRSLCSVRGNGNGVHSVQRQVLQGNDFTFFFPGLVLRGIRTFAQNGPRSLFGPRCPSFSMRVSSAGPAAEQARNAPEVTGGRHLGVRD